MENRIEISSAEGKLGVLLVGLGAVSTTFISGVHAVLKGLAEPRFTNTDGHSSAR